MSKVRLVTGLLALLACAPAHVAAQSTITIFHHNDAESALQPSGGAGGISNFLGALASLRAGVGAETITVSSGDNFLPGAVFNSGLVDDAIALTAYDAIAIGNHEFDLGPDTLAQFINDAKAAGNTAPFLSANLDFSGEAGLNTLVASGDIAKSTVLTKNGVQYGVVGATTQNLSFISSTGAVTVAAVQAAVQAEVNNLTGAGVDNIILISHLQGVNEDMDLIPTLTGVDLVIAGGGDNLLENPAVADAVELLPGDASGGTYPIFANDMSGKSVPIVTTDANYNYIGRMEITFNNDAMDSVTVGVNSGPIRILHTDSGVVTTAAGTQLEQDVAAALASQASNVLASTSVDLRVDSNHVRSVESNMGNLIADAFREPAVARLNSYGVDDSIPLIAIQNGGGIRDVGNVGVYPAGSNITELDTFNTLPFGNILSVVEDVTVAQLVDSLENAVSRVVNDGTGSPIRQGDGTGRFAQVSGLRYLYDLDAQALELDVDGNLVTPGERIQVVALDNGAIIYDRDNGGVLDMSMVLNVATLSFTAGGGDQYWWSFDQEFTRLGVSDQQVLYDYLSNLPGGVLASEYPTAGEGRVQFFAIPEPAGLLLPLGVAAIAGRRRRSA